jgi:multiple sugar transport system substrate-binding protein
MRNKRRLVFLLAMCVVSASASNVWAKATIGIWTHTYASADQLLDELIAEYEDRNPDIAIEHMTVDAVQFEPKLMVAIAGGAQPDIFRLPSWSTPFYVGGGLVAPVDPSSWGYRQQKDLVNLYVPGTLDAYIVGGQLYAIPFEMNTLAVSYRRDILAEVGLNPERPPRTWDDLFRDGKHLVRRDDAGKMIRSAISLPNGGNRIWTMHAFSPVLYQAGGRFLDPTGRKATLTTPQAERALSTYVAPQTQYGLFDAGFAAGANPFVNGTVTMTLQGPFDMARLATNFPDFQARKDYDVTPYFQMEPSNPKYHLWSLAWAVSSASIQQREAWQFVQFLASQPALFLKRAGYIQPRRDLFADRESRSTWYMPVFVDCIQQGLYPAKTPVFDDLQAALAEAVKGALSGANPKSVLENMQLKVQALLDGQ